MPIFKINILLSLLLLLIISGAESIGQDIEKENLDSVIFTGFLKDMAGDYIESFKKEEIVRDFIAGMTDHYFLELSGSGLKPAPLF